MWLFWESGQKEKHQLTYDVATDRARAPATKQKTPLSQKDSGVLLSWPPAHQNQPGKQPESNPGNPDQPCATVFIESGLRYGMRPKHETLIP